MPPIQSIDIPNTRTAFAPYNFVPLPDTIVPAQQPLPTHDAYHAERHTGAITCTLTTASPLYVRGGLTLEQFAQGLEAKDLSDFFYLQDRSRPVIPGSSLRGMLRALVEIAAYGKMDKVTDRSRYFYRAVAAKNDDPLAMPYRAQLRGVRAGYLARRGAHWFIQTTRSIAGEPFIKVREQDIPPSVGLVYLNDPNYHLQALPVSYTTKRLMPSPRNPQGRTVVDRIDKPSIYTDSGWLVTSGNMTETGQRGQRSPRKNHVIVPQAGEGEFQIADTAIADYRNGLSDFQIEQLGPDGVLRDGRPVFYCEPPRGEREVIYFGHSPNFRLPFRFPGSQRAATPLDFVPERLRDDAQIDLAEAIFGFVRGSKREQDQAVAGRVFVGDALLEAGQADIWYSQEPITPRILATPKPTTFQHYLVQPSADRPALKHYASKPGEETVVRGHKLYWHKGERPNIGLPDEQQQINDTQKTQFRPVRPGVNFTFDVRFENLSAVELGALLWVLRLAADDGFRLKLGMGKPLGMGAVKIVSTLCLSSRVNRYARLFNGADWERGEAEAPQDQTPFVGAFETYVLDAIFEHDTAQRAQITTLTQLTRIGCLRALLAWPGPLPEMTRYLEIERDAQRGVLPAAEIKRGEQKVNEYKLRPVLPLPQQITGEPIGIGVTLVSVQPAIVEPPPVPARPAGPTLPAIGDIFTGKVTAADETAVQVAVPGFGEDKAIGVINADALGDRTDRYRVGNAARVAVIGVRTLKSGRVILELKPAAKQAR